MKVLLTGAAGFIGSRYLRKLNDLGVDDVVLVDVANPGQPKPNLVGKKFKDYLSRDALLASLSYLKDVDVVVHLGACADTTERDRDFLRRNNLEYSRTLATWALENNIRFHYASSAAVYGDGALGYDDDPALLPQFKPLNAYAESKWLFDQWIVEKDILNRVVGFRYFNVFGPNEYHKGEMRSMVCKAFDQWKETGKVRLFESSRPGKANGSEERDFVYVKDVNEAMAFFLDHPNQNGIFNLGSGHARTFKDLVTAVFTALEQPVTIEWIPMPETLRGQYQYFTQARLDRLRAAGFNRPFASLEESVHDYVASHLSVGKKVY